MPEVSSDPSESSKFIELINENLYALKEMFRIYEGHSKSSKTNSKKRTSEYGNQIESCKYSHLIWLPYSEFFFFRICLRTF